MSALILSLVTGIKTNIQNFETVFTSSPSFLKIIKHLGVNLKNIKKLIINIDGSSGSGKTTAAKLIGKKYRLSVLYSGLLFRFAALKLIQDNPINKITYLRKIFTKINYNKIKKSTFTRLKYQNTLLKLQKI